MIRLGIALISIAIFVFHFFVISNFNQGELNDYEGQNRETPQNTNRNNFNNFNNYNYDHKNPNYNSGGMAEGVKFQPTRMNQDFGPSQSVNPASNYTEERDFTSDVTYPTEEDMIGNFDNADELNRGLGGSLSGLDDDGFGF